MGGERSPLPHQHALGMSLPSSLSLEPGRGEALRGNRGEGKLTAGSSQDFSCVLGREGLPQEGREGKMGPHLTDEIKIK